MCDPLPVSPQVQTLIQELNSTSDPLAREQIMVRLNRLTPLASNRPPICPVLRPVSARLHLGRLG